MRELSYRDDLDTTAKLEAYLRVRFDFLTEAQPRHEGILQWLGRDQRRIDRIRRMALDKELDMFKSLIAEGVAEGIFDAGQAQRLPALEWLVFQGLWAYDISGHIEAHGLTAEGLRDDTIRFIIHGIATDRHKETNKTTD